MSAPFSVLFSSFFYALAVISKRLLMTRENKIVCQILFNGNALKIFPLCIQLFDNNISWYWSNSDYTFCKIFRYLNSFSMKLIYILSIYIEKWIIRCINVWCLCCSSSNMLFLFPLKIHFDCCSNNCLRKENEGWQM